MIEDFLEINKYKLLCNILKYLIKVKIQYRMQQAWLLSTAYPVVIPSNLYLILSSISLFFVIPFYLIYVII